MAVSDSTDFSLTAVDLIGEARGLLGINSDEEPLEAVDLDRGLKALNAMLKTWQAKDVMAWTMTDGTLALVQGQVAYTFGDGGAFDFETRVFEITDDMAINRGNTDLPMFQLSREEYKAIPIKTTQGYPTQWFYDRQRDGGTLYVWPAPDATAGTLKFTYRRVIMDLDAGPNNFDLPQEWYEAITYNLAVRLIPSAGVSITPEIQLVIGQAKEFYDIVAGFDVGHGRGSIRVTPTRHYRGARNG